MIGTQLQPTAIRTRLVNESFIWDSSHYTSHWVNDSSHDSSHWPHLIMRLVRVIGNDSFDRLRDFCSISLKGCVIFVKFLLGCVNSA